MKITTVLLISFLFINSLSYSQNQVTDTTATVVSYWEKGDNIKYTLIQSKEKTDNGKMVSKGSSTSKIEFKVIDATAKSYIVHWRYAEIKLNSDVVQHPIVEKLTKLTQGLTFKYKTSELGEFQELLNWKEVEAAVFKIIENMIGDTEDSRLTDILAQTKKVFSSKESIEQLIMKDIQMLHNLYGGEYKLKQKITQETELPNFLGGKPFPAILNVEMYELNHEKGFCKIEVSQTIDKHKAAEAINDFLNKKGEANNANADSINISDVARYEIELNKGWVNSVHHTRTAESNGLKNVETKEIKKDN